MSLVLKIIKVTGPDGVAVIAVLAPANLNVGREWVRFARAFAVPALLPAHSWECPDESFWEAASEDMDIREWAGGDDFRERFLSMLEAEFGCQRVQALLCPVTFGSYDELMEEGCVGPEMPA
jgi:hypothetical protein